MTLLEHYAKRLQVSESVYNKATGESLDNNRKIAIATVLNNTNKFLNEAFANSVGTQRADLGAFKKFCLNLTTVALPNLIAPELVIVHPMSSISGYITYVQYTAGSNKGATTQGTVFNDPFKLGAVDKDYTSSLVVEEVTVGEAGAVTLAWAPIFTKVESVMPKVVGVDGATVTVTDAEKGEVTVTGATGKVKIRYAYDNVVIPQKDLPIVNAEIKSLPLVAKARRVAIYYSQIAAFQAKQDYGFDLGDQLAEKAVGQLNYEIDTEICTFLDEMAGTATAVSTFNKAVRPGISKAQHYEAFNEVIEEMKREIYDRTKRFAPTYMLCSSSIVPILSFLNGFKAADTKKINGPYLAGTLNGLKVFVSPAIEKDRFILGVNGDDMMSSAAVYAPYMAVVPTQLLGYADGAMSQGWSTMYALEKLNENLVIAGAVVNDPEEYVIYTQEPNA